MEEINFDYSLLKVYTIVLKTGFPDEYRKKKKEIDTPISQTGRMSNTLLKLPYKFIILQPEESRII